MNRLRYIFLESDISAAVFLMGMGLVLWGVFAVVMRPEDFFTFSEAMRVGTTWFWLANYVVAGLGFMLVAYREFPPGLSLLVSTHGGLVWTWIAGVRGFSNVTSGITLNLLVITVSFMIAQRSKVERKVDQK